MLFAILIQLGYVFSISRLHNQNQVEKSLKVHKKTAVWRRHLFIVQILKSLKLNGGFFSRESEII